MFEAICSAMSKPGFYPHAAARLAYRETHVSAVFLAGPWVYKLKKPVKFDFLDFSDPEKRRLFCRREVRLNRRLSRGIYQGVVAVRRDAQGRFTLGGEGRPVEYAVKMTRLPEGRSLEALILRGVARAGQIRALGRRLANFYADARRGPRIDVYGRRRHIARNMEENFAGIEPFLGRGLMDAERWEFIRQVCRCFLENHAGLFAARAAAGRIRDGHGDLRCEHVYYRDGIQVIDCIEFNDRFRYGDTALDLAFLVMDLDRLGRSDLGRELLAAYAAAAGDDRIYQLVDFYAAYRALVRLKIACLSLRPERFEEYGRLEAEIRRYLHHAYQYALMFGRPSVWVFFGLPASGKSTLAAAAAEALSLPLVQSDVERRSGPWEPPAGVEAMDAGAYRPAMRGRVYARMVALAQEHLKAGQSVILDATFLEAKWRSWVEQLARDMDADQIWVQCVCDRRTSLARLAKRERDPGASDARRTHFLEMERRAAPFVPEIPASHLTIRTDRRLSAALGEVLSVARGAKQAQIQDLL